MENGVGGRKRKRSNKSSRTSTGCSDHKLFADSKVFSNKTVKEQVDLRVHNNLCNEPGIVRMDSNASTHGSDYSSVRDCRKMVLEQMYQSLQDSEGGLQDCIRDALAFDLQGSCRRRMKESVQFSSKMHSGNHNGCKDHAGVCLYGSIDEPVSTNTDLCKRSLFHVLISTKFAELCDLLFVNFQGPKVNCLFDFSLINSRIKEGAYENSPMLFQSDLEQMWTKVQQIGTDMIILAKSLSKKSIVSSSEKLLVQDFHGLRKLEKTEGSCQYNICTCSLCEEKAESSDCLICDYCEEIYHVSCIEPSVQKIPLRAWYCSSCKRKGIGSSHENCLLCESINLPRPVIIGIDGLVKNERALELEILDNLGEDMPWKEEETLPKCKICTEHLGNEKFRQCGQPFCLSKYYHLRCLTVKELNYNASCWYCPSCLCRVCLTNQDNDKLLLCDGCDQAFHMYCLQPPCAAIPTGHWFCGKCDEGMQRLAKVKRAYENTLRGGAKKVKGAYGNLTNMPKGTGEDLQDKCGGIDILLTSKNCKL